MHPVDQKRAENGYMPIYCDPPRRLTAEERKEHPTLMLLNGHVWEPVVGGGQLFYRKAAF